MVKDKTSLNQIEQEARYIWGITLNLLYKKEEGYPQMTERIQSVQNIISGSSIIFGDSPKLLTICALLEEAKHNDVQFRKCIMDSLGAIDELLGEFKINV